MAILTRPAKQGGTFTYQAKVAAGFTKILDTEVDADLDTLYAAWNAGADTVNVKDGAITNAKIANAAGIPYSKLTLTNALVNADIAAAAAILGTKLADAPNGVPTGKINDGAITVAKMGVQASVRNFVTAVGIVNASAVNAEAVFCTLPVFTAAGGLVDVSGALALVLTTSLAGAAQSVGLRLYRQDNAGPFTNIAEWAWTLGAASSTLSIPVPTPQFTDAPAAGHTMVYQLRGYTSAGTHALQLPNANQGRMFARELA